MSGNKTCPDGCGYGTDCLDDKCHNNLQQQKRFKEGMDMIAKNFHQSIRSIGLRQKNKKKKTIDDEEE